MWRKDIEIILARQLASYLNMPIFIVDSEANLLFYNEPAEDMLGQRFQEVGMMSAHTWGQLFHPVDEHDNPLAVEDLPLMLALQERRPIHCDFIIRALNGERHHIEVTAVPLIGIAGRFLGGMAIFWERPQ